jgi:hypothetical protein
MNRLYFKLFGSRNRTDGTLSPIMSSQSWFRKRAGFGARRQNTSSADIGPRPSRIQSPSSDYDPYTVNYTAFWSDTPPTPVWNLNHAAGAFGSPKGRSAILAVVLAGILHPIWIDGSEFKPGVGEIVQFA